MHSAEWPELKNVYLLGLYSDFGVLDVSPSPTHNRAWQKKGHICKCMYVSLLALSQSLTGESPEANKDNNEIIPFRYVACEEP